MSQTINLIVENKFGVLARIAGLFSARGYNIESLSVARTEDPTLSHITLVSDLEEKSFTQLLRLLDKLVDVVSVEDLSNGHSVERELVLLKVRADQSQRMEILKEAELFRARVVHVGTDQYIFEATGDTGKIEALIRLFEKYEVQEVARTGAVAMTRNGSNRDRINGSGEGGRYGKSIL